MNRQSIEINCNCYGPILTHDKYFLTRSRNHQESDHPSSSRRDNKSTEIKPEETSKSHKKSLKKRPNSFHHSHQNSSSQINQHNKMEVEPKIPYQNEQLQKNKSQWARVIQTPMAVKPTPQTFIQFKYPETTVNARQPQVVSSHRQVQNRNFTYTQQIAQPSYVPTKINFQKPISNLRPQLQHFHSQTIHPPSHQQPQVQPMIAEEDKFLTPLTLKIDKSTLRQEKSRQSLSNQVSSPGYLSHDVPRGQRMVTQSWAHNEEDLIIQGFDKLFKKEENLTQSNLPSSKRNNPREHQKSKRLENQRLMGRFAQSDGEDSDSPPSQVIGRGFDRTYQDLLMEQTEKGGLVSQTKASRSTNTRVSQMNLINRRLSAFTKDNFSNFPQTQFKTFKHF